MTNSIIKILDWDSNFFEMRVAKVLNSRNKLSDLKSILEELEKEKIDLAYFTSKSPISDASKIISGNFEIKFVDERATFLKKIGNKREYDLNISEYKEEEVTPELLKLAIESGVYSRFKIDEKIPNSRFEELYRLWMINSVSKKISDAVLVYKDAEKIIGFVTIGKKNERGNIGIIAVDAAGRGKGIGKSLVKAAEYYCSNVGLNELQVVTQKINIPACSLYKKCGFDLESTVCFYHIWQSKI